MTRLLTMKKLPICPDDDDALIMHTDHNNYGDTLKFVQMVTMTLH